MNYRRRMTGTKRVLADQCCGAIIDYQDFFLEQIEPRGRARLRRNMASFARLLAYLRIPTILTLERPVDRKGAVPADVMATLGNAPISQPLLSTGLETSEVHLRSGDLADQIERLAALKQQPKFPEAQAAREALAKR